MSGHEGELKVLTIQALRTSHAGLDEFKRRFERCSAAYENGDDREGASELRQVLPHLGDFARFCDALLANLAEWLAEHEARPLVEANQDLAGVLERLLRETANSDLPAVGDVLRIDFCGLMHRYGDVFTRMADLLEARAA